MLHLIPAPLHILGLRVAHRIRNRWRRLSRKAGASVMVIGVDEAGRVLLVRHSYGSGRWSLPGGGLGRGEDPEEGARREMREELACELERVELVLQEDELLHGAEHRAFVFTARFATEPRPDGRELTDAAWFDPAALPREMVGYARMRLKHGVPRQDHSS